MFFSAACVEAVPRQVQDVTAPCAPEGAEWGFGAERGVVLYSQPDMQPLAGRVSKVENGRILVSAGHGLAAFVYHREQPLQKI